ncbi:uncharacterized protein LOC126839416 [Adelges cooleyi]|uniref:uncharacterized protein LOC126839416 n=1 Tax=Adelges cooleyi TaxID=133065 RepID=UPI0021801195|nr:uncharacterized protein LOC126839416 [Adelges cooleyi]
MCIPRKGRTLECWLHKSLQMAPCMINSRYNVVQYFPYLVSDYNIKGVMDVEWSRCMWKLNQALGGIRRNYKAIVFINEKYIGTEEDFQVYLAFNFLFTRLVPKTCGYFKRLCLDPSDGYLNTPVHRISFNSGFIQAGRKTNQGDFFKKENFKLKHDRRGVISLAGRQTSYNGPEFVISLQSNPWMDGKYVAFGCAVEGEKTLRALERWPAIHEVPVQSISIGPCDLLISRDYSELSEAETAADVRRFLRSLIDGTLHKSMYIQVYGQPERCPPKLTDVQYAEMLTRVLVCRVWRVIDLLPPPVAAVPSAIDVGDLGDGSETLSTSIPSIASDWNEKIVTLTQLDVQDPMDYRPYIHV